MMQLEDLALRETAKIVDGGIFEEHGGEFVSKSLYTAEFLSYISPHEIEHYISKLNRMIHLIRQPNFFSIPEVGEELKDLLRIFNNSKDFHSYITNTDYQKKGVRKLNRFRERYHKNKDPSKEDSKANLDMMKLLSDKSYELIKRINKVNILRRFSREELEQYRLLTDCLIDMCNKNPDILHDYSNKYNSEYTPNHNNFNTDQKLVAASIIYSGREPVDLVSRDTDIWHIMDNLNRRMTKLPVPIQKNPVNVYLFLDGTLKKYTESLALSHPN
jgi:hypothetical protein